MAVLQLHGRSTLFDVCAMPTIQRFQLWDPVQLVCPSGILRRIVTPSVACHSSGVDRRDVCCTTANSITLGRLLLSAHCTPNQVPQSNLSSQPGGSASFRPNAINGATPLLFTGRNRSLAEALTFLSLAPDAGLVGAKLIQAGPRQVSIGIFQGSARAEGSARAVPGLLYSE